MRWLFRGGFKMTKKIKNNLNSDKNIGTDKLEEYLVAYDEESIQKNQG